MRPPRDGSFRIHPSLGTLGREPTRPCEALPQSLVLAGYLPPDGGPSFSIQRPCHAGVPLVSAPGPAQRWVRLRPRSTACGLPLRPTRTRPARLWIATIWHDSSVAGPAPALVRSVWGLLAPASSDSDTASPAPDQPRSGMIAQSWVRLRPESAACEAPAPSDLDTASPAPPGGSGSGPGPHLRLTRIRPATSGLIAQSWILVQ